MCRSVSLHNVPVWLKHVIDSFDVAKEECDVGFGESDDMTVHIGSGLDAISASVLYDLQQVDIPDNAVS